jgi:hypothetical protein
MSYNFDKSFLGKKDPTVDVWPGFNPYPWVPTDIAGCVLWLRSDLGITKDGSDRVSQWNDQSGQSNHATQSTDAKKPVWIANQLNGHPSIRLQHATQRHMDLMAALPVTGFSVFFVGFHTYAKAGAIIGDGISGHGLCLDNSGGPAVGYNLDNGMFGSSIFSSVPSGYGNFSILTMRLLNDMTTCVTRQNGAQTDSEDALFGFAASFVPRLFEEISGPGSPQGYLDGDCVEFLVYNVELSNSDCELIETYLNGRYAIY